MSRGGLVCAAVLVLVAPAAAEQEGAWYPMPHDTREAVDEQHATCTVDGWWSYNRSCCCTHGWCAPITRSGAVREERGGWRVTLRPGDHPNVLEPTSWWVPPGQAGRSPDGRFHFCGHGSASRCFLVPAGGHVTAFRPIEQLVPVPADVARRAWECAVDLAGVELPPHVRDALSIESRVLMHVIVDATVRAGPEAVLWRQAHLLFGLHRRVFGRRA